MVLRQRGASSRGGVWGRWALRHRGWLSGPSVLQLNAFITILFWGRICVRCMETKIQKCFVLCMNVLVTGEAGPETGKT